MCKNFNELEKVNLILEGVSYQRVLDRGFSLVTDRNGKTVSAVDTAPGMLLDMLFRDGCVRAKVETESVTKIGGCFKNMFIGLKLTSKQFSV